MSGKHMELFLVEGVPGDITTAEMFRTHLHITLPVLGVNAIRERARTTVAPAVAAPPSPNFHLRNAKAGVDTQAQVNGEEFTVLENPLIVGAWTATGNTASTRRAYDSYRAQHNTLVADGSIAVEGRICRRTRQASLTAPPTTRNRRHDRGKSATALRKIGDGR